MPAGRRSAITNAPPVTFLKASWNSMLPSKARISFLRIQPRCTVWLLEIMKVDNGTAGRQPTVTFTVKDKSGAAVPLNQLNNVSLLMAGPTSDYGYTSFGSDVTTPGYVSESATGAQCNTAGTCTYTFQHAIPADAKGSFAIGIESRRTETLLAGTTDQMDVRYGAANKVFYFSVDGSAVQPRRTVVQTASCNQCHALLSFHGDNRNQVEMCVLCHNPSLTASPDDPNQPARVSTSTY